MSSTEQKQLKTIFGQFSAKKYNALRLFFYALMIVVCHMASCFLFQKIFKTPYNRSHPTDGVVQTDYFTNPFAFGLLIFLFSYLMNLLISLKKKQKDQNNKKLPWYEPAKISCAIVLESVLSTLATILSSFILFSIISSCQLIAVVILAVFFSRATRRVRIKKRQIIISIILCLGVIMYVLFDKDKDENPVNKPLGWLSGILLLLMLFFEALKPELFAQIRDKYQVSTSFITLQVFKYTFILMLIASAVSLQLWELCVFCWNHDRILLDLTMAALLNAIGLIFCFRTCLQYKQHVMPTIGTIRKLFSALLSSIYFHHNINALQYGGLGLVFGGVLVDIYLSSRQPQIKDPQHSQPKSFEQENICQQRDKDQMKPELNEQNDPNQLAESLITKQ